MNEYSDNHSLYIVVARVLNQINIGFSPSEMTALAPKPITVSGGGSMCFDKSPDVPFFTVMGD